MSTPAIITRFAPSPTGALHVGGARTALFNWAYARQHGGRFLLRFEDTDRARSNEQSVVSMIEDLQWLGLDWDDGPDPTAPLDRNVGSLNVGPYFQSQRLEVYQKYVDQLLDQGQAYRDEGAVRMKMRADVAFTDQVYGPICVKADELEDFVIQKGDGFPTFHLAVVVDDALMGITHVIRGQEHLYNTTKHVALQDALGLSRPTYAHTPSIMNPDNSKMSKRDKAKIARQQGKAHQPSLLNSIEKDRVGQASGLSSAETADPPTQWGVFPQSLADESIDQNDLTDFLAKKNDSPIVTQWIADKLDLTLPEIDVADFRRSGYLPGALLNYLSLLGWSPGDNQEQFEVQFIVDHFGLDRINKSNAKFDRDKLRSFNSSRLADLPSTEFASQLQSFFERWHPQYIKKLGEHFELFAQAYQQRSSTWEDPASLGRFFMWADDQITYDAKAVKKILAKNQGQGIMMLQLITSKLDAMADWLPEHIDQAIKDLAEEKQVGMGAIAQPLRVAVTGCGVSPSIDQTLVILGKTATLARIERCAEQHAHLLEAS